MWVGGHLKTVTHTVTQTVIQLIFSQQLNQNYGSLTDHSVTMTDHEHYGLLHQAN